MFSSFRLVNGCLIVIGVVGVSKINHFDKEKRETLSQINFTLSGTIVLVFLFL